MGKKELTAKQQKAILAILEEKTIEAAAEKAGVAKQTLYNWLRQDEFRELLEQSRRDLFTEGMGRLRGAAAKAAQVLIDLLSSTDRAARRLSAKDILILAQKSVEAEEFEARISKLEEATESRYSQEERKWQQ